MRRGRITDRFHIDLEYVILAGSGVGLGVIDGAVRVVQVGMVIDMMTP